MRLSLSALAYFKIRGVHAWAWGSHLNWDVPTVTQSNKLTCFIFSRTFVKGFLYICLSTATPFSCCALDLLFALRYTRCFDGPVCMQDVVTVGRIKLLAVFLNVVCHSFKANGVAKKTIQRCSNRITARLSDISKGTMKLGYHLNK